MTTQQNVNPSITNPIKNAIIIFTIGFFAIAFAMNLFMRKSLFLMGLNFIYDYQHSQPSNFVATVFNLWSLLGNTVAVVTLLSTLYFIVYKKILVLVYLTYMLTNIYLMVIMKQGFQQARPYWFNEQIQQLQWNCEKQYGFPSGHSWISLLLYEPLIMDLIGYGKLKYPWNKLPLLFPILACIFVPLSRQYLGSHSKDQIIFGLFCSFSALVLYRFQFQKNLYELFSYSMKLTKTNWIYVGLFLSYFIVVMIPMIIYLININMRSLDHIYIENIEKKCHSGLNYQKVQQQILQSACYIHLVFGFLFGCLISSLQSLRKYNFYLDIISYLTGSWSYQSFANLLKFLLINAILAGLSAASFLVLLPQFISDTILKYLIKCIGMTLIGIILIFVAPVISVKFEVIKLTKIDDNISQKHLAKTNQQQPELVEQHDTKPQIQSIQC